LLYLSCRVLWKHLIQYTSPPLEVETPMSIWIWTQKAVAYSLIFLSLWHPPLIECLPGTGVEENTHLTNVKSVLDCNIPIAYTINSCFSNWLCFCQCWYFHCTHICRLTVGNTWIIPNKWMPWNV
jgi:hypothetical protein